MSSAINGMAMAQQRFDQSAWMVASAMTSATEQTAGGAGELVEGLVGATIASGAYTADLAMLRTALDMQGSLVDVLA